MEDSTIIDAEWNDARGTYAMTDREIALVLASLTLAAGEIPSCAVEVRELHKKLTLLSVRT